MQPEDRDAAYLWDMLQAAREAVGILEEHDITSFLSSRVLLLATERSVEIIGEAARRISDTFTSSHPEVPWREIIGQRNILAHEYGQIDHELLYKTATEDLPGLIDQLESLLPPLDDNSTTPPT